jgi:hypothetical protein
MKIKSKSLPNTNYIPYHKFMPYQIKILMFFNGSFCTEAIILYKQLFVTTYMNDSM